MKLPRMSQHSPILLINVALLMLAATRATAQQTGNPGYGHGHWDGPWHGWMFGPFGMLLMVALVVVAVVLVVRLTSQRGGNDKGHTGHSSQPTPLDILKERFARGEIDQVEFEEKRRILNE